MNTQQPFAWADKRWSDPLTGTEVVCLTPDERTHYRSNYFRFNMTTQDGVYLCFLGSDEIREGTMYGNVHIYARNLHTGEVLDLGVVNHPPFDQLKDKPSRDILFYKVAPHSNKVNLLDYSDPNAVALEQIDIDKGTRRKIQPRINMNFIYEPNFSADEQYTITPWVLPPSKQPKTKRFAAAPGYQEMVRIHLETGNVERLFGTDYWFMGHPNPHPSNPDLFMCCQEWYGLGTGKVIATDDHERVRIFHIKDRTWIPNHRITQQQCYHEHWAREGQTIYGHNVASHDLHFISRIRPEHKEYTFFPCPLDKGSSGHVTIAPNETFLVGEGHNFDQQTMDDTSRQRIKKRLEIDGTNGRSIWYANEGYYANGGETIWKYVLPSESSWDSERYTDNKEGQDRLRADLKAYPALGLHVEPICKFRTMKRSFMLEYRLESNAKVTPDSEWVLFQSASEDNRFEIWAARVV
jgi:hypothetical protein